MYFAKHTPSIAHLADCAPRGYQVKAHRYSPHEGQNQDTRCNTNAFSCSAQRSAGRAIFCKTWHRVCIVRCEHFGCSTFQYVLPWKLKPSSVVKSLSHILVVASAYRHYASQAKEHAAQSSAGTQPPQQPPRANALQPQLRQQVTHLEQAEAEQTAVSNAAKEDAHNWKAQLRAACHTITHDQVNNLDAAKEEMARALMYIKSTEQIFQGLKRQHESVTGMLYVAFSLLIKWLSQTFTLCLCCWYASLCVQTI